MPAQRRPAPVITTARTLRLLMQVFQGLLNLGQQLPAQGVALVGPIENQRARGSVNVQTDHRRMIGAHRSLSCEEFVCMNAAAATASLAFREGLRRAVDMLAPGATWNFLRGYLE